MSSESRHRHRANTTSPIPARGSAKCPTLALDGLPAYTGSLRPGKPLAGALTKRRRPVQELLPLDPTALTLAVLSGLPHAGWNLLVKRHPERATVLWGTLIVSGSTFFTIAVLRGEPMPSLAALRWASISALPQALYLIGMLVAYRDGDLGVVYPVARGSAPLFLALLGITLLREHITAPAAVGIALVVLGAYTSFVPALRPSAWLAPLRAGGLRGAILPLGIGLLVAGYTLADKRGLALSGPFAYGAMVHFLDLILLSVWMVRHRNTEAATQYLPTSIAAGLMMATAYSLALMALSVEQASYVGTARNASLIFGVILGALVLGERAPAVRLIAASAIVAGIALLGLG